MVSRASRATSGRASGVPSGFGWRPRSVSSSTRASRVRRESNRCSRKFRRSAAATTRQSRTGRPMAEGRAIDGLLLVDKPSGITSHDVVSAARRALATRRIGHAGTLDPFATGLLVLLMGHATRLLPYLDAEPKEYQAAIAFGAETDTDDATGVVVRNADFPRAARVRDALPALTGSIDQVPPAYSAKQVGGRRAYDAARRGAPLALEP